MKGKAIIPLALGLCIGLVAVKFGINAIREAQAGSGEKQSIVVVRAVMDIDAHAAITPEMVDTVEIADESFAPADQRMATVEDVVGRVTAKAVPAQMPILETMLAPVGTKPGMVGRIPPGFRAVSVRIDEVTGVAYQLSPGDWVDVIVVMDVKSSAGGAAETVAEVILQHVQVAAIGRSTGSGKAKTGPKARAAKSATLFVQEADVPKLHLAGSRGKLTLAMRGDDETTGEPVLATGPDVFESERLEKERREAEQLRKEQEEAARLALAGLEPAPETPPVAAPVEPAPRSDEPYAMLVFHDAANMQIVNYTFENEASRKILGMSAGPTGGVSSLLKAESAEPPRGTPPLDVPRFGGAAGAPSGTPPPADPETFESDEEPEPYDEEAE